MPLNFRRPGVPTGPRETALVTGLIEASKQPGFVRRSFANPNTLKPDVAPVVEMSTTELMVKARADFHAELKAMTDAEFDAYIEAEGLTLDHDISIAFRELRRSLRNPARD